MGRKSTDTRLDHRPLYEFWFGDGKLHDADYVSARIDVWFKSDREFDEAVRDRFAATLACAADGGCEHWTATLRGSLSLVILFDQIPRNIHRGAANAFSHDARAFALAQSTLARADVHTLSPIELMFLYMPFEHAEDMAAQNACVAGYRALRDRSPPSLRQVMSDVVKAGEDHREVIRRFGRFPHRNAVLGRVSTPEEVAWSENHHGWGQGPAESGSKK